MPLTSPPPCSADASVTLPPTDHILSLRVPNDTLLALQEHQIDLLHQDGQPYTLSVVARFALETYLHQKSKLQRQPILTLRPHHRRSYDALAKENAQLRAQLNATSKGQPQ